MTPRAEITCALLDLAETSDAMRALAFELADFRASFEIMLDLDPYWPEPVEE